MFSVADIIEDAKRIFGTHESSEYLISRVDDAVQLLANKGNWDPLHTYLDVRCASRCCVLPPEVDTVLAVSIDGFPALGRDRLFQWHINGPGSRWSPGNYEWLDDGRWPVMSQPNQAVRLVTYASDARDHGTEVRVWAFNAAGVRITGSTASGATVPWISVPVLPYATPVAGSPLVARIERVEKAKSFGRIRLASSDWGNSEFEPSGNLFSDMGAGETSPQYRRIQLSRDADVARLYVRRVTAKVSESTDLIPLHQRAALVQMFRALKAYDEDRDSTGMVAEATALRWLSEREHMIQPPVGMPQQVSLDGGISLGANDDTVSYP